MCFTPYKQATCCEVSLQLNASLVKCLLLLICPASDKVFPQPSPGSTKSLQATCHNPIWSHSKNAGERACVCVCESVCVCVSVHWQKRGLLREMGPSDLMAVKRNPKYAWKEREKVCASHGGAHHRILMHNLMDSRGKKQNFEQKRTI